MKGDESEEIICGGREMREPNLISEQDLSVLKIKLGKSKRSEKDWSVIKSLLSSHDVIVPEVIDEDKVVRNVEGAMCVEGYMIAFTNPDDCSRQMRSFSEQYMRTLRWQLKCIPFNSIANLADKAGVTLCVDMITDGKNRFITYSNGRVEASMTM